MAELGRDAPWVAVAGTVTAMVIGRVLLPGAADRVPRAQMTVFPLLAQPGDAERNTTIGDRVSVTVTPEASSGPAFTTVRV